MAALRRATRLGKTPCRCLLKAKVLHVVLPGLEGQQVPVAVGLDRGKAKAQSWTQPRPYGRPLSSPGAPGSEARDGVGGWADDVLSVPVTLFKSSKGEMCVGGLSSISAIMTQQPTVAWL